MEQKELDVLNIAAHGALLCDLSEFEEVQNHPKAAKLAALIAAKVYALEDDRPSVLLEKLCEFYNV